MLVTNQERTDELVDVCVVGLVRPLSSEWHRWLKEHSKASGEPHERRRRGQAPELVRRWVLELEQPFVFFTAVSTLSCQTRISFFRWHA